MLIERIGRRILMMISSIMVSIAMASMAIYLMFLSEIPQNFRKEFDKSFRK